jgi:hypothetical protein
MTPIHFHYTSKGRASQERCVAAVSDLAEARDHATRIVRSLMMDPGPEDLRSWILHASDELGNEPFVVPFAFVLGKPH